ncbi:MAG: 7-cyano-7-deazaguanine synthase [Thermoprotei archaeon]|nr:7-cyano-7-deazaguanine synthase [TACK group archaeon]
MSNGEDRLRGLLEKEREIFVAFSGGLASTLLLFMASRAGHEVRAVYVDTGLMRKAEEKDVAREVAEKAKAEFIVADARETIKKKLKDRVLAKHKVSIVESVISSEVGKVAKQAGHHEIFWAGRSYSGSTKETNVVRPFLGMNYMNMYRMAKSFDEISPDGRYHVPSAGLSLRSHGIVDEEKLDVVREATAEMDEYSSIDQRYVPVLFPVLLDQEFRQDRMVPTYEEAVTPIFSLYGASFVAMSVLSKSVDGSDGNYGKVLAIEASDEEGNLILPNKRLSMAVREKVLAADPSVGRILLKVKKADSKKAIVIRAMQTYDLIAAEPYYLPPQALSAMCESLNKKLGQLDVYFDITPKPPGTIEFE